MIEFIFILLIIFLMVTYNQRFGKVEKPQRVYKWFSDCWIKEEMKNIEILRENRELKEKIKKYKMKNKKAKKQKILINLIID